MDGACQARERAPGRYQPRRPQHSVLYRCVSNTSRPGSPNAATATMTRGRCRSMCRGSSAVTWNAASSPAVLPAPTATGAGTTFWSPSPARAAACAHHAMPGAWWRRQRISPTTSCRRCRCASGSWPCPGACATSCTATPISKALLCGCSCGWWSNACGRTVQVQAPRPASAPRPSSTASARHSMPTCTSTVWSSTTEGSPLAGRRVRRRHHRRGHLPGRHRARCQHHRRRAGMRAPAAVARVRAPGPAAAR